MAQRSDIAIEFFNAGYRLDDSHSLLSELNLTIAPGEVCMLLGRSGSGKTTSLKLINRLLTPTDGEVRVEGVPTTAWDPIKLRRRIGYAIQEVGLFPHYTVAKNVGLVPRLEGWDRERIDRRVQEVMELVGLPASQFSNRYPSQLSGGQRQRAGLARALAADPPILLMDEPFGALDPLSRVQLQQEFKSLQQRLGKTVVFVTHDVGEALLLGDHIALLEDGKLRGVYNPQEFVNSTEQNTKAYVDAYRLGLQALDS